MIKLRWTLDCRTAVRNSRHSGARKNRRPFFERLVPIKCCRHGAAAPRMGCKPLAGGRAKRHPRLRRASGQADPGGVAAPLSCELRLVSVTAIMRRFHRLAKRGAPRWLL